MNKIEEGGRYFLYRHVRPDKNEPFYIGIGTNRDYTYSNYSYSELYHRAYSKQKRNPIWKRIVNKNNGKYQVEIRLESNSYSFIKQKEKEFIKFYGRKDLKTGTLANLTDGGEGTFGVIPDKYVNAKKVYVYSKKDGKYLYMFNSTQDAGRILKISRGSISSCALNRCLFAGDYICKYEYLGEVISIPQTKINIQKNNKNSKTTLKLNDVKDIVEEFPSLREVERLYNYKSSIICNAIKRGTKRYGFYWKYK